MRIARVTPPHHADTIPLPLPQYKTAGAAGMDLAADVGTEGLVLSAGEIKPVPTGFIFEIPEGFEGQIRPRSGLASKGITVINSPGTIDCDYRGEVKVLLINLSGAPYTVTHGERIAQFVLAPVARPTELRVVPAEALTETIRGAGGFGSTGKTG